MKYQRGLTLLELLIGIAILGIVFGGIVPSGGKLYKQHRVIAHLNTLSSLIQLTRAQAIEEYQSAVLCPSSDYKNCDIHDWNKAKILFFDRNHNLIRDENEALVYVSSPTLKGIYVKGPQKVIRFYEDGVIGSPASLIVCSSDMDRSLSRAVFISLQGRVRLSSDTNKDGLHEKGNGDVLEC